MSTETSGTRTEEKLALHWQTLTGTDETEQVSEIVNIASEFTFLKKLLRSAHLQADKGVSQADAHALAMSAFVSEAEVVAGQPTPVTFNIVFQRNASSESAETPQAHEGTDAKLLRRFTSLLKPETIDAISRSANWNFKKSVTDVTLVIEFFSPCAGAVASFRVLSLPGGALKRRVEKARRKVQFSELRWLRECRSEQILSYDVSRYPFTELIGALLELGDRESMTTAADGAWAVLLSSLHEKPPQRPPLWPTLANAFLAAGHGLPKELRGYSGKQKERLENSPEWRAFIDVYKLFVKEVCAPLCRSARVVAQCPPTLRIVLPGAPATIRMHKDADYPVHWSGEINFWLPVTYVFGSNTLWLESAPNADDFRPMELEAGQFLKFNGYECRHYTIPNETSSTRISFDWRAIPEELCPDCSSTMIGDYPAELL